MCILRESLWVHYVFFAAVSWVAGSYNCLVYLASSTSKAATWSSWNTTAWEFIATSKISVASVY